jgi:DNA-directed RNA polymerase specialized sigma24 family protein
VLARERCVAVARAFRDLSATDQWLIRQAAAGASSATMAAHLGVSTCAVRTRLHRGRRHLALAAGVEAAAGT